MPSLLHESHLLLFRNQPALAAELIRDVLHVNVPRYSEARVDSAELTDIQPAEYRADLVMVPKITDAAAARANPELAVLSAMAHGQGSDTEESASIAMMAERVAAGLDADRAKLYFDLIMSVLSEAARHALNQMDARKYEYRSDFARQYVAQGVERGMAQGVMQGQLEGRAALIARQLAIRFGPLNAEAESKVRGSSIAELDAVVERLLVSTTLQQALGE